MIPGTNCVGLTKETVNNVIIINDFLLCKGCFYIQNIENKLYIKSDHFSLEIDKKNCDILFDKITLYFNDHGSHISITTNIDYLGFAEDEVRDLIIEGYKDIVILIANYLPDYYLNSTNFSRVRDFLKNYLQDTA